MPRPALFLLRSFACATGTVAAVAFAQTVHKSPEQEISALPIDQIDQLMAATAATVAKSVPIQADEITQVVGAVYLKPLRTLNYRVRLSQDISSAAAAAAMKPGFCSGSMNKAFMSRGVKYQYSVTTPAQSYIFVFGAKDC